MTDHKQSIEHEALAEELWKRMSEKQQADFLTDYAMNRVPEFLQGIALKNSENIKVDPESATKYAGASRSHGEKERHADTWDAARMHTLYISGEEGFTWQGKIPPNKENYLNKLFQTEK